jgi:hypothetical protein
VNEALDPVANPMPGVRVHDLVEVGDAEREVKVEGDFRTQSWKNKAPKFGGR